MRGFLKKGIGPGAAALLVCLVLAAVRAPAATVPVPPAKPAIAAAAADGTAPVPAQKPGTVKPGILDLLGFAGTGIRLDERNAALYRDIFAAQAAGKWDEADALSNRLSDKRLRGYVLYQRYMHPTAYRAQFKELADWLEAYADLPGADRIYKLAERRKPAGYAGHLRKPVKGRGVNGYLDIFTDSDRVYRSPRARDEEQARRAAALTGAVEDTIAAQGAAQAWDLLRRDPDARLLDDVEFDALRGRIAGGFLAEGEIAQARTLAAESARRSGSAVPTAGWIGGLAAWREGRYAQAASLFELAAASPYVSDWTAAGAAYWASRSHLRAGHTEEVSRWLREAASHPRTFYGLIATRALGWDFDFNWDMPAYTPAHEKLLMTYPQAQRAALLVAAGQVNLAEKELRRIDPADNPALTEALLAFAAHEELPSYAMRLAASVHAPGGRLYDAALYPLLPWEPESGYTVDRALVHALIRQESRFDPAAESHSGALGLMQLMPATASFMSGHDYRSAEGRYRLRDPRLNLDLGQRYVESLLGEDHVDTELFSMVIAYNAGPGNLRKWKGVYSDMQDDPLLFIESIPLRETRSFVEKVMANYWIYRLRLGQETPSLDAVAQGNWARYVQLDRRERADAAPAVSAYRLAEAGDL